VEAHVIAAKKQQLAQLESSLEFYESENTRLIESVKAKREQLTQTMDLVNSFSQKYAAKDTLGQLEACL
jgi:hypothetical protein